MPKAFRETLATKEFIITTEAGPSKGSNVGKIIEHIDLLKDKVDAMNVTDNQSSIMRYPSLGVCLLIKEHGGEPVFQITCRDRNRIAIQADLLFAWSRGISNVLAITGDLIEAGDHKEAKAVFDLDSVQLIRIIHALNSGKDSAGNELDGGTDFCIGAVANVSSDPIEPQLFKVRKKVESGIDFIQTQGVYDLDDLKRLVEFVRKIEGGEKVKILAGIIPLISARMAEFMNQHVAGIFVPQLTIDEIAKAPRGKGIQTGIEMSARMIRKIKEEKICDGVHVMFIGHEDRVPDVLTAAGLL